MTRMFTLKTRRRISAALIAAMIVSLMAFVFPNATFAAEEVVTLIANHDVWKYDDTNTNRFGDQTTDFRSKDYDDSAWQSGASPLGYPETDNSPLFGPISGGTLITKGANGAGSSASYVTYYFRKSVTVENVAAIKALNASVGVDDGFVMYLNGYEVARVNMPDGPVSHTTDAPGVWEPNEDRANLNLDITAYKQYLAEGKNTIAVDVHNRDSNSSDIYWGMSLTATYDTPAAPTDVNKTPKQVNVHMGDDPSDAVNVTYTTVAADETKIVVKKADGTGEPLTFTGEASPGSGGNTGQNGKYVHKIPVTGLEANTAYTYEVGNEILFAGQFKTAPEQGSNDPIRFVYLADTQVSNATNAEALGATLNEVAKM
ncbi:MAG: fibronectin type III domain-containing protein, partial [Clostridiales Family XIII bacterium]|nr:fibronectin type III domain-containing protein [Clostridiales Family XIII bacterium]